MRLKLIVTLTAFCFLTNLATAQSLKKWTWDDYKMEFKAPNNFSIDKNSSSEFDAGNGELHLTIYPRKGEKMAYDDMKAALRKWSKDNNVDGEIKYMSNLNGYWGVYVDGTASNGLSTSILLIVDPDYPTISFYVWLQYQSQAFETAVAILKSFKPL